MDVLLTCTYEGVRKTAGKTQAVISLDGEISVLKTDLPIMRPPTDRVTGLAVFDVDAGFISQLNISLRDERNLGGLAFTRTFAADVTRTEGNSVGVQMPVAGSQPAPTRGLAPGRAG